MSWQEMRPLHWSEVPAPIKALRIVAIVGWLATLADFAVYHSVYVAARLQPQSPDSVYRHQITVGNTPRFISDKQNETYAFVRPLGLGLWSLTAISMGLLIFLEYRLAKMKRRQTVARVLQDNKA